MFQRLCREQKHLKITPSRKPRCPSPSIRGTFVLFPFSTLLSRRLPCSAAYFRTSSVIFMLQKCGPHLEQKCACFADQIGQGFTFELVFESLAVEESSSSGRGTFLQRASPTP